MAVEIADAYVSLYVKMPGVKNDITEALGGAGKGVEKSGETMGAQLMDGMNKIGKVGAVALGGALAAGVGTALVKGFQRLDTIDQATAKLTGLGHSAESVDQIMNDALASVKGTAFGMGEAATTAAGAVAAGIKPGADLERTLKLVADASTIAGTDMGSMGAIFNKVASSNKVQMDTINQLHDAGVPALSLLADQMGVTAEEASKMASKGEIDFATFQAAIESGMGGAALASGDTFSGAMDNVMASLGRMGEGLLKGIFPDMKDGLGGLLEAMAPLEQVARDVGEGIKAAFDWISQNWDWIQPFAIGIGIAVGAIILWTGAQWLLNAALTANPIGLIIVAIGLLVGAIIWLVQNWDEVIAWIVEVWQGFVTWFGEVWEGFVNWLGEVWEGFVNWLGEVWAGFVGFLTDVWSGFMSWITDVLNGFVALWNGVWGAVGQFISDVWNNIVNWVKGAMDNVSNFISGALGSIRSAWENVWNGIGGFLRGVWNNILSWIEGGVNGAIDLINGMIGGISDVAAIIGIEVGTIPHVRIPRLAEGGVVSRRPGGILANIGEGRYDEAVVPLSPEVLGQLGGGSGLRSGDTLRLAVGDREFTGYVDERADGRAAARGNQVSSAIRNRRWADA